MSVVDRNLVGLSQKSSVHMPGYFFDSIDSTNEAAKRMIRAGELREPAYLIAREQTAGRGSHGRSWMSPRDAGIYLTVVETPIPRTLRASQTVEFTLAAGVACAEAIVAATGVPVRLKPVNDLFVDGAKLGGILTEATIEEGRVRAVITGVGINVRRADRPIENGAAEATCLEECMSPDDFAQLDANALSAALVVRTRAINDLILSGNPSEVRGRWVRFKIPGAELPDR